MAFSKKIVFSVVTSLGVGGGIAGAILGSSSFSVVDSSNKDFSEDSPLVIPSVAKDLNREELSLEDEENDSSCLRWRASGVFEAHHIDQLCDENNHFRSLEK